MFIHVRVFILFIYSISYGIYQCSAQELSDISYLHKQADTAYIKQLLKDAGTLTNPDSAIRLCNYSLLLSEKTDFHEGVIRSYRELGVQYREKGNINLSHKHLKSSLNEINKHHKYNDMLAGVYTEIGNTFSANGSYDSAVVYFHKSLEMTRQYPDAVSPIAPLVNLGRILGLLKNYNQALYHLNKAIFLANKEQDYEYLIAAYQNIAVIYAKMDSIALSQKNFHLTLLLSRQHNLKRWEKKALANLAVIADLQGRADSSIWYYEAALAIGIKDIDQDISMMGNIGYHYYLKKDYSKAEIILNKALSMAQPSLTSVEVRLYLLLARVAHARKQYILANQLYERYITLYDSIQGIGMADKVNALQTKFEHTQKDNELIKRELKLTAEKATMQRRNIIAYSVTALLLALIFCLFLYYRYRRRIELRDQKQTLEVAAWKASLEGEEKERRRLAHELHDNIGGNLSTLKMWLENIQNEHTFPTEKQERNFKDVTILVNETLTEVRNTAHHLMPELLLRFGLTEAVRIFCLNIQKVSGIEIQFHYFGYIGQLGKERELIIYRTIQELVQNIVKHAAATAALVQLSLHEVTLTITIEDNGKGFDPLLLEENKGMGLESAKNSIEKSGGQFIINSEPGNGTTIEIEIKLDEQALTI